MFFLLYELQLHNLGWSVLLRWLLFIPRLRNLNRVKLTSIYFQLYWQMFLFRFRCEKEKKSLQEKENSFQPQLSHYCISKDRTNTAKKCLHCQKMCELYSSKKKKSHRSNMCRIFISVVFENSLSGERIAIVHFAWCMNKKCNASIHNAWAGGVGDKIFRLFEMHENGGDKDIFTFGSAEPINKVVEFLCIHLSPVTHTHTHHHQENITSDHIPSENIRHTFLREKNSRIEISKDWNW